MGDMADYYADLSCLYEYEIERWKTYYHNIHFSKLKKSYKKNKLFWYSKDGRKTLIQDIDNNHLDCLINFTKKNKENTEWFRVFYSIFKEEKQKRINEQLNNELESIINN